MCSVERLAPHGAGQLTVCPSVAVAEQLSNAIAWLPSVALAWLVLDASAKLSLVAVASLLVKAPASLSLVALAVLFSLATAVLPFSATAWEVESDEQMLVPFCTLTAPLLLTHTSPPFPGAEHITNTNSTHYIQLENPQLVTDSIRRVVDAASDGANRQSRGAKGFGTATPSATPSATATVSATSSASASAAGAAQYQYTSALPGTGGVSPLAVLAVIPAILLGGAGLLSARVIRIS
jgi:hypothetical protein